MFVCTNSADDFADELLPVNNSEDSGSIEVAHGIHNRNVKRDAMFVNILIDMMDKFYVSKKVISKRSQYEEVIVRDKTRE